MSKSPLSLFPKGFLPYSKNHFVVMISFSLVYLLWTNFVLGFRQDHINFFIFIVGILVLHQETRKIAYFFLCFILFWIIYDSMRIYPNYLVNDVSITPPYLIEKSLFGISTTEGILTPNEYFKDNSHTFFDVLTGLFYLSWVPVPLGLGIYLYRTDKKMLLRFSAAYLFANLIGFCIYYIYPAAPPWYFAKYGDVKLFDISGDPAQLVRFDHLVGFPLFSNMYSKNANVFAAIPSLHAAYPVITWYYARKKKLKWASILIFVDILGIWFAAVYSFHHYFIDVLLGLGCAIAAIFIFEKWLMKSRFSLWLEKYHLFAQSA